MACIFANMMSRSAFTSLCSFIIGWSLRLTLFLVPIYFAWFQENFAVFDLNKTLILHFLIGVALIAWLLRFSINASSQWAAGRFTALLGMSVAVCFLLSTVLSIHPHLSFLGSYERQQGLLNLWHYLALFFLISASITDRRQLEGLIISLLCSSALVSLYGLIQLVGWDFLRWGESSQMRIFSTFGQPNFLGHFLSLMLPLTAYAIAYLSPQRWQRIAYCLLGVAELVCLVACASRGSWLATIVTIFAFLAWELWRRRKKAILVIMLAFVIALISIVSLPPVRKPLLAAAARSGGVAERLGSFLDPVSGSGRSRILYWQAGWNIFREAPLRRQLFGLGPDVQADAYASQYRADWAYYEQLNSYPDRAHNFLVDIPLQFGLIGSLALLMLIFLIAQRLLRSAGRQKENREYWLSIALLAALLIYGINDFLSFSLTAMSTILYALLAMSAIVANDYCCEKKEWHFFHEGSRWIISVLASVALISFFYSYAVRPYIADYYFFKAKKAEAKQDCRALLDNMEKVMEWYPEGQFYQRSYLHMGTNCFSAVSSDAGRRQLALNLLDVAETIPAREMQYQTLMNLAQAYSIIGYYVDKSYTPKAEEAYRQLISWSPYITVNYQDYGRLKLWEGKNKEAAELFRQGIAMAPRPEDAPNDWHLAPVREQISYLYYLLGSSQQAMNKVPEAIISFKKSLEIYPKTQSAYKSLADISYQSHDLDAAISYNEQGFALDPENGLWPFGLATLYKEKGERAKALSYARQALKLDPNNSKIPVLIKEIEAMR